MSRHHNEFHLQSEETIISELQDTFNFIPSQSNSNILNINTSTYSVSRTAHHISNRLYHASERLKNMETSLNKNKKHQKEVHPHVIRKLNSSEEKLIVYDGAETELMNLITNLTKEIGKKNTIIEELEEKLCSTEKEFLKVEQKYLKQENKLMTEINSLKDQLEELANKNKSYFDRKVELERLIDETELKNYQNETKILRLTEDKTNLLNNEVKLKKAIKRFDESLSKDHKTREAKYGNRDKKGKENYGELIKTIRTTLGLQVTNEEDKENNQELSNRAHYLKMKSKKTLLEEALESEEEEIERKRHENVNTEIDEGSSEEELYRLLFVQASTIEKLVK